MPRNENKTIVLAHCQVQWTTKDDECEKPTISSITTSLCHIRGIHLWQCAKSAAQYVHSGNHWNNPRDPNMLLGMWQSSRILKSPNFESFRRADNKWICLRMFKDSEFGFQHQHSNTSVKPKWPTFPRSCFSVSHTHYAGCRNMIYNFSHSRHCLVPILCYWSSNIQN